MRKTREIQIGNIRIGAGHPVAVQSMTNTPTKDVAATVQQILSMEAAGCDIVRSAVPAAARRDGGHPARKTFQAIRIAVNGELDKLSEALDGAFDRLAPGGRFAIITFHSLEDRMVKKAFAEYTKGCTCPPEFPVCVCGKKPRGKLVNKKPIEPGAEELEYNHRSRSAKLRIIEKL